MNVRVDRHHSSGLETLINDLVTSGGSVLDLGPMSSGTTEAFLRKGCTCHVEDIADVLPFLDEGQENFEEKIEAHLLPKKPGQTFDVILCWDLLNYLTLNSIETLFNILKAHFKPNTYLHMMQYTSASIPAQPMHFRLIEDFTYEMSNKATTDIPSARHTTIHLLKRLGNFQIAHSHINQEGMSTRLKELILSYGDRDVSTSVRSNARAENVSYFLTDRQPIDLPVLQELLLNEAQLKQMNILDLGKKSSRNLDFLNRTAGRLFVEDLYSSMVWKRKLDGETLQELRVHTLQLQEPKRLDLVLSWDVLNFCTAEQLAAFGLALSSKMMRGGLLYLVSYADHQLPDQPAKYHIDDAGIVSVSGHQKGVGALPFASTAKLLKLLPDFVLQGYHYGTRGQGANVHEYLLARK